MIKICDECGEPFEAKRSTARFCSSKCRKRSHRRMQPLVPDAPPSLGSASFDDVAAALDAARAVSNELARLSRMAPRPLRPGCSRISDAIASAIAREEW